MARRPQPAIKGAEGPRVRRAYFESRFGQLHVHHAMPPGGGFDEATPLLCIHDAGETAGQFVSFLYGMGNDRSVYATDLPGVGMSDGPDQPAETAVSATVLGEFLDAMRIRRVDVMGVGEGARVAAELVKQRPEQVRKIVQIASPAGAGVPSSRAVDLGGRGAEMLRLGPEALALELRTLLTG